MRGLPNLAAHGLVPARDPAVHLAFNQQLNAAREELKSWDGEKRFIKSECLECARALCDECAPRHYPTPCSLGVGCEQAGVCYAVAHGQPHQCGAA